MKDEDMVQLLVHPAVRPALWAWLQSRGIDLGRLPDSPQDLVTYVMTPAEQVADVDLELPQTGVTLAQARRQLSGLHFSKESLSEGEREVLHLAEGLLRLVDERDQTLQSVARSIAARNREALDKLAEQ